MSVSGPGLARPKSRAGGTFVRVRLEHDDGPRRPAPLTMTVAEAAERLGPVFTADWLRKHLSEIPHERPGVGRGRGGRVGFTEAHLEEILALYEVRPRDPPSTTTPHVPPRVTRGGIVR